MMQGPNPFLALKLLIQFDVLPQLLKFPQNTNPPVTNEVAQEGFQRASKVVETLTELFEKQKTPGFLGLQWPEDIKPIKKDVMYGGILLPFKDHKVKVKKRQDPAFSLVVQNSLKKPNESRKFIETVLLNYQTTQKLVNSEEFDPIAVGRHLADLGDENVNRKIPTILTAIADEMLNSPDSDLDTICEKYHNWITAIEERGLGEAHLIKPIVNGKEIMELLSVAPGGILREILKAELEWMYANPQASKDEVKEFLKTYKM